MALSVAQMAQMSRLLDEALLLDETQRQRWLDNLAPEHRDLLASLRQALAEGSPTLPMLQVGKGGKPAGASALNPGQRVGPYQLVRELGAGGMAEVWLAHRADGAYKRTVALKLPTFARGRKDLARRFAQERDILASLEHPNIARLYDAGVGPDGLPYLAMEYVPGEPLTAWCDTRRVGLRERLQLFLQVLDSVQFAHTRRVIHRDLKPSNILVSESGHVRLLDFGIAKLLAEDEDADRAHQTQFYARALTPDYASPELLLGESVDAASDVYSLGVVLYELLSGGRPYQLRGAASLIALQRSIEAVRVHKPSAQLEAGAGLARATTQVRLASRLRGELDAVVLKTLARGPADRYATAAALADDLQAYLRGEPVEAKPPRFTAEELVDHLSRNPKLRVSARSSVAPPVFRAANDRSMTPRHRPADGANASDPTSSATLRITAQLISADGALLWSRAYDRALSGPSEAQRRMAGKLALVLDAAVDAAKL